MATPTTLKQSPEKNSSVFTIPPVYDAIYFNTPDAHSVLVHTISSSGEDEGFQAVLCFHPRPDLPSHLGLPSLPNYEERAFLQVAPTNQPFLYQTQALRSLSMQITVTEYLILLKFIENDWPRLKSKLTSQMTTMREGTDPVYITGYLMFYNHGSSHYRVSLSSRLFFVASIESRDAKNNIKTKLERHPLSDQNDYQEMMLPVHCLAMLTQDTIGMQTLVDQMGAFKTRSRKRTKTSTHANGNL
jgi:hypothetical protein